MEIIVGMDMALGVIITDPTLERFSIVDEKIILTQFRTWSAVPKVCDYVE